LENRPTFGESTAITKICTVLDWTNLTHSSSTLDFVQLKLAPFNLPTTRTLP